MRLNHILAIAGRKFASLRRDHRTFAFIVVMPAIQIVLMGVAIGQSPTALNVILIDETSSQLGENMSSALMADESLIIDVSFTEISSARDAVESGDHWAVVHLTDGEMTSPVMVQLHLDNSNQQVSNTIMVVVRESFEDAFESQGLEMSIEIANPIFGSQNPEFIHFLAPGIMTMVCFMFSVILTSMAFVGERHDGTLDRVFAAGTRPAEVMFGHLIAYSSILVGQVTVVILISVWGFDIPIEGSVMLLFLLALLLGWAAMCFGLFVSSKARSEFQAMQMNMPVIFPVLLLSGILWPIEALPDWILPLSQAMPTTWTAEAFRSIMIRGWGLDHSDVIIAFLFNIVFAVLMLGLAARSLRVRS